ncbi:MULTISPECIES: RNA polymerase sigma factor [Micromonospora]|uniref:RNA polymerase sigma-70 factor, ECF subfamily n=1 Tax=Micromonospora rifamycinica TaxID=291594 RepID=A0A120F790_9ACTN|nr:MULTISPECIES: RNA polymerase sigma factor [Micromonospora]KWV29837.1 RNA polymerase subunit sigma-24 [Micromonospora rifamycinica]WFE66715.1 RNA polymerase sigma factor [Micromonospora sp. WMMD714]SCG81395.1 RNA polymerase sigma-70 factor, ECF subfamily [Micromonospora rifamycinica]
MLRTDDIDSLARAAARGEPGALDALLTAVRPEVLRLCGRLLPHREDAEEACQDALLAVARGIGRFEGRSSFHTWLYRITANRARSTYRALRRRWQLEAGGVPLPDPPDPQRTSVVAGTRLDLLDALDAVRPEAAEALTLRDLLGLSYREIATLLDVPEGTVKSRVHLARRQVRERLTGD